MTLSITTASLPNGVAGDAYQTALAASGGVGQLTWSISSGALPAGTILWRPGYVGATTNTAGYNGYLNPTPQFDRLGVANYVDGLLDAPLALTSQKVFIEQGGSWWLTTSQISTDGKQLIGAGCRIYLCIKPSTTFTTTEDANVVATIQSAQQAYVNAGFLPNVRVVLWQEMNGGTWTDTTANFIAYYQHYYTAIKAAVTAGTISPVMVGWDVATNHSTGGNYQSFYPGDNYVDFIGADYYGNTYWPANSNPPYFLDVAFGSSTVSLLGLANNNVNGAVPLCVLESGDSQQGTTAALAQAHYYVANWSGSGQAPFCNYIASLQLSQIEAGYQAGDVQWYSGTNTKEYNILGPVPNPSPPPSTIYVAGYDTVPGLNYIHDQIASDSVGGTIAGTPTTAGTYSIGVTVTDEAGNTATQTFSIVISSASTLTIPAQSFPNPVEGTAYSESLTATGGTSPYTWSMPSGTLPPGFSPISSAGLISGTATAAGAYTFTAKVTDSVSATATRSITLTVNSNLAIATTFAGGITGTAYSQSLTATGGTAPYSWSIVSGSLPDGLTLSGSTVSGTPLGAGTSFFRVAVTDAAGSMATLDTSILIGSNIGTLPGNILTPADSDFEVPGFTWLAQTNASSIATSGADSFAGGNCLSWTCGSGTFGTTAIKTAHYTLTDASLPYIASLWVKPATNLPGYLSLIWLKSNGASLSQQDAPVTYLTGGVWQPLSIAGYAPASAGEVRLEITLTSASAGDVECIDLAYLAQSKIQVLVDWFNPVYGPGNPAGQAFMDVSPFVRFDSSNGIALQSGRQDAISEIQPGSATFTLQNDSGIFTRFNAQSPLIQQGASISTQRRFQVNVSDQTGMWWTRADGIISEIDYTGDNTGNTNLAAITGSDVLAYLNRQDALSCWTKTQVLVNGPSYHWTLNDAGNSLGAGVAAETSGNNGPPMRLRESTINTTPTLAWQDNSGGVETLADAVAAAHPDGSEYWLPGQLEPTSWVRGLDAGVVGTFVPAQSVNLANGTTPTVPLPSVTVTPILTAGSAQNYYTTNNGDYLQVALPESINPAATGDDYSVEMWYTQDPAVLTDQGDNYGPYIPISLGNSRTQSCLTTGIFLPTSFGVGYYPQPPAWFGRNFGSTAPTSTWLHTSAITLDSVRRPHHVVITIQGSASGAKVTVYLDGDPILGPYTLNAGESFDTVTVGAAYGGGGAWYGNLSLVSVYPFALTASQITWDCMLGQYGMWEQTADDCIAQLATAADIPPFWNNVSAQHAGLTLTDYQDITGSNPVSAMQTYYEQAEGGLLFVDRQGRLNFHTRDWRMGYGSPDLALPEGSYDADMGLALIDQFQVNEEAVNTNTFNAGVAYVNADSQQKYGTYATNGIGSPITYPLIAWSRAFAALGVNGYGLWGDPNLIDMCSWIAETKGEPWLLPSTLKIDLLTIEGDPSIGLGRSDFFPLEIGSMVAPTGNLPASFPDTTGATEWFIEGINETLNQQEHTLELYCSPAQYQRAWRPGDSDYGILGSTSRLGISAPDLSTPQADGKDVSHDAGPPYWVPTFEQGMNNPSGNGHDFIGMTEIRGLVSNLQNALTPPIAAVGAFSENENVLTGAQAQPQISWDTIYADTASGMGIIPGYPNWYCCVQAGWYEIDAQLPWERATAGAGACYLGWIIVAQAAAQAVAAGSGNPQTVDKYICPIGEAQRRNGVNLNSVCAPTTRLYLGLGDMIALGAEQDTGANATTGTNYGGAYLSLRYLGLGTQDDRVQVNSSMSSGGTIVNPPVVTKKSATFTNTATYSYFGNTAGSGNTPNTLRYTNGVVLQGNWPNNEKITGSQYDQIVFDVTTIRSTLSGVTLTGLTLTSQNQETSNPTSTLLVGYFEDTPGASPWNLTTSGLNVPNISAQQYKTGQSKTWALDLRIAEALLGSANGLLIGNGSWTPAQYYGQWAGGANSWTLTFHYKT